VNLYLTQDRIGTPTGGGAVTYHEYRALADLGFETHPVDAGRVQLSHDPFMSDERWGAVIANTSPALVHTYAGCFTKTVESLKSRGAKVTYTAAAHDISESRREHEELGVPFNFPHLTDPVLWERYVGGYKSADVVICPSRLSKKIMESFGCKKVVVIPHGCEAAAVIPPLPKRFALGYMGQAGPDKGLRYLFEAWKRLAMKDAVLVIAGSHMDQAYELWKRFGGGNVEFMGFVPKLEDFYAKVSVYCQPSVTEGYGMEALEASVHGRLCLISDGAGAVDLSEQFRGAYSFRRRDVDDLAGHIERIKNAVDTGAFSAHVDQDDVDRLLATQSWKAIRLSYQHLWRSLDVS
jgi:glycosyltransferase involved in cell wall biosynthesis